ncbi:DUF1707 SHOCT-like domain-containing protein [Glycomyces tarimensis]
MTDDQGKLRISNAERDEAVERLQQALDEGRIELSEFDERTKAAYAAKTNGELSLIFDDLPLSRADDKSVHTIDLTPEERAEREAEIQRRVRGGGDDGEGVLHQMPALRALLLVGGMTTAIWLVFCIATGELRYFWPIWPIFGLAIVVGVQWMGRGRGR